VINNNELRLKREFLMDINKVNAEIYASLEKQDSPSLILLINMASLILLKRIHEVLDEA
jgi:hypothetical protein